MTIPLIPTTSVVVNAHVEKELLRSTLESIEYSLEFLTVAERNAFNILIILDNSDSETSNIAFNFKSKAKIDTRVFNVSFSDLGEARNFATDLAESDWLTFIDGDDLMGPSWLKSLVNVEFNFDKQIIYHPSYLIYFGNSRRIHYQNLLDDMSTQDHLKIATLYNPWGSPIYAHRKLLLENRYSKTKIEENLGFEDWTFNRTTLLKNIAHMTIPSTFYLIRDRDNSLSKNKISNNFFPMWS
jgi:glycosyltransferase involved in cell wall biosynthesis